MSRTRLKPGHLICDQCEAHALRWFRAEAKLSEIIEALDRWVTQNCNTGCVGCDNCNDLQMKFLAALEGWTP